MGGTAAVIVRTQSDIAEGDVILKRLQKVDDIKFDAPLGGALEIRLHE